MQNPAFGSLSLESIISRTTPYGIQSGVYACIYTNPDIEGNLVVKNFFLEGPRRPRAQTIPQWKPTLILELGALPKA